MDNKKINVDPIKKNVNEKTKPKNRKNDQDVTKHVELDYNNLLSNVKWNSINRETLTLVLLSLQNNQTYLDLAYELINNGDNKILSVFISQVIKQLKIDGFIKENKTHKNFMTALSPDEYKYFTIQQLNDYYNQDDGTE